MSLLIFPHALPVTAPAHAPWFWSSFLVVSYPHPVKTPSDLPLVTSAELDTYTGRHFKASPEGRLLLSHDAAPDGLVHTH